MRAQLRLLAPAAGRVVRAVPLALAETAAAAVVVGVERRGDAPHAGVGGEAVGVRAADHAVQQAQVQLVVPGTSLIFFFF